MLKKTICLLLSAVMVISVFCASSLYDVADLFSSVKASEIIDSGTCGENLTWTLDSNGLLTISGSGEMMDYDTWDVGDYSPFFYKKDDIRTVIILDGVTDIGDSVFFRCTGLTSITIPNSITGIGFEAFYGCSGLTSITIPDSATYIGRYAFAGCENLKSVNISDSVTCIDSYAFKNCVSLTSITIPDGVKSIEDGVFYACSSLDVINIADSVINIGYEAFRGTKYYEDSSNWTNSGLYIGNHLIKADYYHGANYIQEDYLIKNGTVCIASYAFFGCEGLSNITIPESVKGIGRSAFSGCRGLLSVKIPSNAICIGDGAFTNCSSLNSISVDERNGVYHSDGNCLIDTNTKSLLRGCLNSEIPNDESVKSIAQSAFSGCSGLSTVVIPDNITSIGNRAFADCSDLTKITIPDSVTNIEEYAFSGTTIYKDKSNWADNILYIGKHLIKANNEIQGDCIIRNGTVCIADGAFFGCSSLISLNIPDGVTGIGDSAFSGCDSLNGILIPNSVTNIGGYAFMNCTNLKNIRISDEVTSIEESVFNNCTNLTTITIPNNVKTIGERAFVDCNSLENVTIPNSVNWIKANAFNGCSALIDVFYSGTEEQWESINIEDGNLPLTAATIHFLWTPGTEPTSEPTTQPTTQPPTVPTTQTTMEPTTQQVTEPTTEAPAPTTTEPTSVSITDPTTKPTTVPTKEPVVEPVPDQTEQPTLPDGIFDLNGDDVSLKETDDEVKYTSKAALTKSALVAAIVSYEATVVIVKDKDGNEMDDDATLGTGSTVTVIVGEVSVTKVLIFLGDVDGDATVNASDARLALRAAAKLDVLEGPYASAADTDGDNTINATDARGILRAAAKLDVLKVA